MLAAFPTLGNRIWRRVAALALFFALLFGLIAFAQLKFVRQQYFVEDEREQLQQTVADVTHVLFANRHWTLEQYRRTGTDLAAHEYVIVISDGLLVDSAVKRPAIFASALPIGSLDDSEIKTVATELNETWLLGTRKIGGGRAFVGMIHESDLRNPDRVISADLAAFGANLQSGVRVRDQNVSPYEEGYIVLDDAGQVRNISGALPFKVKLNLPDDIEPDKVIRLTLAGKEYAVLAHRISDVTPGALIVAVDDLTDHINTVALYTRFNWLICGVAAFVALIVAAGGLYREEFLRRQEEVSLEDALRLGEGQNIEFKEGIFDTSLVKAIAAFANTNAGNVFIGVSDDGAVRGLGVSSPKQQDELLQKIGNLVSQKIKPPVFGVRHRFWSFDGKTVLRVFVPRGNEVVYLVDGVTYVRQMTSVRTAGPSELQSILKSWRRRPGR